MKVNLKIIINKERAIQNMNLVKNIKVVLKIMVNTDLVFLLIIIKIKIFL